MKTTNNHQSWDDPKHGDTGSVFAWIMLFFMGRAVVAFRSILDTGCRVFVDVVYYILVFDVFTRGVTLVMNLLGF